MAINYKKKKTSSGQDEADVTSRALELVRENAAKRQPVQPGLAKMKTEAMNNYLNREDFKYDFNADPLYQHYKDQYIRQGRAAMEDTMGQAAALTGGYGSSYAQNVGHQAYDAQLQNLNDVIPQLYQMAYDQYRDKESDLLQHYSILSAAEAEEYDRQHQAQQDAVSDYQWQKKYDYQAQQDAIANALAQAKLTQQLQSKVDNTDYSGYQNGSVSKGNVKIMQRILGVTEDGYWGYAASKAAGGLTADQAWEAYQRGSLQYRYNPDKAPQVAGEETGPVTIQPHTELTREFIRRMPSAAAFGGSGKSYRQYIDKQIKKATYLTEEEARTLAAHYGIPR